MVVSCGMADRLTDVLNVLDNRVTGEVLVNWTKSVAGLAIKVVVVGTGTGTRKGTTSEIFKVLFAVFGCTKDSSIGDEITGA